MNEKNVVDRILDLARWAPSGDNTQPWRFEIAGDRHVVVHGSDTRTHCVYDLDGHPSQLSIGMLIETMAIAASGHGLRADVSRRTDAPDEFPVFDVRLVADAGVGASPLLDAIPLRSVQRRAFSARPLTADEKRRLEAAVPPGYRIRWFEGDRKWPVARLMFRSAEIRLTTEEAYRVHRDIIVWNQRYSDDRVPDQSLGVDKLTLQMMRWAMADWRRLQFLNRYLGGTLLPRLRMDLLPGLRCAAHLAVVADAAPRSIDDYVAAGRAAQRVWLTAAALGLQHQPEMTPLIFSRYVRQGRRFTGSERAMALARQVSATAEPLIGEGRLDRVVWMGRIGQGERPQARSLRLPLDKLTIAGPAQAAPALQPATAAGAPG